MPVPEILPLTVIVFPPSANVPLVNAKPVHVNAPFTFNVAGVALVLFKVRAVIEVTDEGIFKGPASVPPKLKAPVMVRFPLPEIAGPFNVSANAPIENVPLVNANVPDSVNAALAETVAGVVLLLLMVKLLRAVTLFGTLNGPAFDPVKLKLEDDVVTKLPAPIEIGFPAIVSVLLPVRFNAPAVSVNVPLIDKALFTKTPAALFIVRLFNTLDEEGISNPKLAEVVPL